MSTTHAPLTLTMHGQPDDSSCGPTALTALYKYFNQEMLSHTLYEEVPSFEDGGTLLVMLANHALAHGFSAELISYNIRIFDPSWSAISSSELCDKLKKQAEHKYRDEAKFKTASDAYIQFLEAGGKISFHDLDLSLLDRYFNQGLPILTGLNVSYLYQSMREYSQSREVLVPDDIKGESIGHFVILCGREGDEIFVADPYEKNPLSHSCYYSVAAQRLFHAILLGIITYEGELLVLSPKEAPAG